MDKAYRSMLESSLGRSCRSMVFLTASSLRRSYRSMAAVEAVEAVEAAVVEEAEVAEVSRSYLALSL